MDLINLFCRISVGFLPRCGTIYSQKSMAYPAFYGTVIKNPRKYVMHFYVCMHNIQKTLFE